MNYNYLRAYRLKQPKRLRNTFYSVCSLFFPLTLPVAFVCREDLRYLDLSTMDYTLDVQIKI